MANYWKNVLVAFSEKNFVKQCRSTVKKETEDDWNLSNKIVSDVVALMLHLAMWQTKINDVDGISMDPFIAAARANKRELDLSEGQRRQIKKRYV
ncbi:hypothetical protein RJT34_26432 [Clitoria ternatea]|uniref:Uncharacterized protein n=1 Tax=Clitoria ternatea TaxID=43366 RepID=A0AAN9FBE1_CLITE